MNFESLFVNPSGRTSRGQFIAALITLLAVVAFYAFLVRGRTAQWCMLVLVFPAFVLHARRLHDMGHTAWLLLAPAVLMVVAFAIWLQHLQPRRAARQRRAADRARHLRRLRAVGLHRQGASRSQ